MKIIILGAGGNLGCQLQKVFENDNEIFAWDKEDVDICQKKELDAKIDEVKPDLIINTAAYNAVDKCEESEEEFIAAKKLNGEAVAYIAEASLRNQAILIHFSSDHVFGGHTPAIVLEARSKGGFAEDDPVCPINKYALSKLAGEDEILKRQREGLKFYLVRLSWLFGPRGESKLAKPAFFDIMLDLSKKQEEIKVVNDEVSAFTYSPDLALALKNLVLEKKDFGIYHITNSEEASWLEGAQELFALLKTNVRIRPISGDTFSRPAKRPGYSALKNTKLKPLRSYREALREYLEVNGLT